MRVFLLPFTVFLVPPVGQPLKTSDAAAREMWPKDRGRTGEGPGEDRRANSAANPRASL